MGINNISAETINKYLPAKILSLGYPDNLNMLNMKESILDTVDIKRYQGTERIVDLSYIVDLGEYDLVLDLGTTEHCSNPAQCLINSASAVKLGGRIIHHLPTNMFNHGYWNMCPLFFRDFYKVNNFILERFEIHDGGYGGKDNCSIRNPQPKDITLQHIPNPSGTILFAVAQRTNNNPIILPKCQEEA